MNAEQLFDAATKEAKRLSEILPILQTIREDPMSAFNEIVEKEKEIRRLKLIIKELNG